MSLNTSGNVGRHILLTIGQPGNSGSVSVRVPVTGADEKVNLLITMELVPGAGEVKEERKSAKRPPPAQEERSPTSSWCRVGPGNAWWTRSARGGFAINANATPGKVREGNAAREEPPSSTGSVSSASTRESPPYEGAQQRTPASLDLDPDRTRENTPCSAYNPYKDPRLRVKDSPDTELMEFYGYY
jgi:hypothetical protein